MECQGKSDEHDVGTLNWRVHVPIPQTGNRHSHYFRVLVISANDKPRLFCAVSVSEQSVSPAIQSYLKYKHPSTCPSPHSPLEPIYQRTPYLCSRPRDRAPEPQSRIHSSASRYPHRVSRIPNHVGVFHNEAGRRAQGCGSGTIHYNRWRCVWIEGLCG